LSLNNNNNNNNNNFSFQNGWINIFNNLSYNHYAKLEDENKELIMKLLLSSHKRTISLSFVLERLSFVTKQQQQQQQQQQFFFPKWMS
jgi:hypothetical protein